MKKGDNDIIFSKTIKAGKRIYYLDVKESRKGELFLVITESKQITVASGEKNEQQYEKHKIFLYREDFNNFFESLAQIVEYIEKNDTTPLRQNKNNTDATPQKDTISENEPKHWDSSFLKEFDDILNNVFDSQEKPVTV